jgi:type II secretory pathway pseudopilin PulG
MDVAHAHGPDWRKGERGISLVTMIATLTIMAVMISAAVPYWRYVMKDAREEELLFRGEQIARAIEKYQKKHNTLPPNMEILVQQRFLRRPYKEPFAKDGKWRLVRPGEPITPPLGIPGVPTRRTPPSTMVGQAPTATVGGTMSIGGTGILGVASLSRDKSLRVFNGRTRYDEWMFIAGQMRMVGPVPGARIPAPGGLTPSASPAGGGLGISPPPSGNR